MRWPMPRPGNGTGSDVVCFAAVLAITNRIGKNPRPASRRARARPGLPCWPPLRPVNCLVDSVRSPAASQAKPLAAIASVKRQQPERPTPVRTSRAARLRLLGHLRGRGGRQQRRREGRIERTQPCTCLSSLSCVCTPACCVRAVSFGTSRVANPRGETGDRRRSRIVPRPAEFAVVRARLDVTLEPSCARLGAAPPDSANRW